MSHQAMMSRIGFLIGGDPTMSRKIAYSLPLLLAVSLTASGIRAEDAQPKPDGDRPAKMDGEKRDGDRPDVKRADGERPDVKRPDGERADGKRPDAERREGERRMGDRRGTQGGQGGQGGRPPWGGQGNDQNAKLPGAPENFY